MRYYNLMITDAASGALIKQYTSTSNGTPSGTNNGAALNIEFDLPVASYDAPMGNSYVRVWGIPFADISQSANFTNQNITLEIGLTAGLPLANPSQAGLVLSGTVFQAFGNWQGTLLTLDLIIAPATGTPANPVNLSFNWPKNTQLSKAIAQSLSTAYPTYQQSINISSELVYTEDQNGFYADLNQFGNYLFQTSKNIIKTQGYAGVRLSVQNNVITVTDNSNAGASTSTSTGAAINSAPITLSLNDFMSQPTWIDIATVQIDLVARHDLSLGQVVNLPKFIASSTQASFSPFRDDSAFTGTGTIIQIRHVGNLRQLDGDSWKTVVNVLTGA